MNPLHDRSDCADGPGRDAAIMRRAPSIRTPLEWMFRLWRHAPDDFRRSPRRLADARPWPAGLGFDPVRSAVFAHNERLVPTASPHDVFRLLVEAHRWPGCYANVRDVELGSAGALGPDARFAFTTFATRQRCRVVEFESDRVLTWTAEMPGNRACHRWILEPVGAGTRIVTEECNDGILARLDAFVFDRALHASHALWLRGIEQALVRADGAAGASPPRCTRAVLVPGVGTKTYEFPTRLREIDALGAAAIVRADRAARLLPPGWHAVTIAPGRALAVFTVQRFGAPAQMAPYREATIAVLARAPSGDRGLHVVSMPVTSDENVARGHALFGYPKKRADVVLEGRRGVARVDGDPVFTLTLDRTSEIPFELPLEVDHLQRLDGLVVRIRSRARGRVRVGRARIETGAWLTSSAIGLPPVLDAVGFETADAVLDLYLPQPVAADAPAVADPKPVERFGTWRPPPRPASVRDVAHVASLARAERVDLAPFGAGPEDLAVDHAGTVYAGLESGVIVRVPHGAFHAELFATGLGRPLGLEFGPDGWLYVCDAFLGLVRVATDGTVERLAEACNGERLTFPNNLDVARDGTVYFTDSSRCHPQPEYLAEVLSHDAGGRLLAFDPRTRRVRVVRDGLVFANGVALGRDEASVLVAEMGRYRIVRHWLRGPKAGTIEPFVENLPGFPDNLSRDADGNIWVGLSATRSGLLDALLPHPTLRRGLARVPHRWLPRPAARGVVLAFDAHGRPIVRVDDPAGDFGDTTSARRVGNEVFVGSLTEPAIARLRLGDVGHPNPDGRAG